MATVRLDPQTEAALKRLAKRRGQTQSEVIRDAIHQLAEGTEGRITAYQRLEPFAGVADSGGLELSTRTGSRFREMLEEKNRARRSG